MLIIDKGKDMGGAWCSLNLFGLNDVENAIHYFYLSQQALEESGYVRSTGIAEGYWHESRYRYLVFGHELCRYTSVKEFYESKGQEGKAFEEFCKTPKPERFDPEKNQGQSKFMNEEETEKD